MRPYRDLGHELPGNVLEAEVMEATAHFHHGIADMVGTQPNVLLEDATAFDCADDVLNPNTTL